jgi:hypothetical protein
VNDKVVDALQQLATKLGQTVEALWPHAVRYEAIDGAVNILVGLVLAFFSWKLFKRGGFQFRASQAPEAGPFRQVDLQMAGAGIYVLAICLAIAATLLIGSGIPQALEPTGALVKGFLPK